MVFCDFTRYSYLGSSLLRGRRNNGHGSEECDDVGAVNLRVAQHALLRMDVVGLTEDMEGFERALRARWPDTFGRKGTSRCSIPSGAAARNPTSQHTVRGNASTALDEATRAAIRSLNQLDLRVYDLAKAIAASQAECVARVAKLDEAGGQRGREARRCFAAVRAKLQNRGAVL